MERDFSKYATKPVFGLIFVIFFLIDDLDENPELALKRLYYMKGITMTTLHKAVLNKCNNIP